MGLISEQHCYASKLLTTFQNSIAVLGPTAARAVEQWRLDRRAPTVLVQLSFLPVFSFMAFSLR
jgi:hypothetical protein